MRRRDVYELTRWTDDGRVFVVGRHLGISPRLMTPTVDGYEFCSECLESRDVLLRKVQELRFAAGRRVWPTSEFLPLAAQIARLAQDIEDQLANLAAGAWGGAE